MNVSFSVLPPWQCLLACAILGSGAGLAAFAETRQLRWNAAVIFVVALAGFWVVPLLGNVKAPPRLQTPELEQLSSWARTATPRDAVFLFADAGRQLQPGVFRAEALRAIYVDWKGGGQVNYLETLGQQWWSRWQQVMAVPFHVADISRYRSLGIDYIVLSPANRVAGRPTAFENSKYLVYAL